MRKMLERNKCKVNEPHAKLEHRRFNDYDVDALNRGSHTFYDYFVRKLHREIKSLMNEMLIFVGSAWLVRC